MKHIFIIIFTLSALYMRAQTLISKSKNILIITNTKVNGAQEIIVKETLPVDSVQSGVNKILAEIANHQKDLATIDEQVNIITSTRALIAARIEELQGVIQGLTPYLPKKEDDGVRPKGAN